MENETTKTIIEVLAKEIRNLKVDILIKEIEIEELKKKLEEAHGNEVRKDG